jgi:predicted AAA+ superfamily ATPase
VAAAPTPSKNRRYRDLDDFAQLEAARRDPEAFVAQEGPLTIDEVQKCPESLTAIKREVARRRQPGRFLLSGSANLALLRGITESLAGRATYFTLWPFTRRAGRDDAPIVTELGYRPGAPAIAYSCGFASDLRDR